MSSELSFSRIILYKRIIMSNWLILIIVFEFTVFVLSAIFYRSLKANKLVSLPYFLFFILAGELLGFWIAKRYHSNTGYYNTFSTLQIGYYLLLIYHSICSAKAKKNTCGLYNRFFCCFHYKLLFHKG